MSELKDKLILDIFNLKGNFKKVFNPHRDSNNPYFKLLFDDDGDLRHNVEHILISHLDKNPQLKWNCDMSKLCHAEEHGSKTKGSYPAIYYWR